VYVYMRACVNANIRMYTGICAGQGEATHYFRFTLTQLLKELIN